MDFLQAVAAGITAGIIIEIIKMITQNIPPDN